MLSAVEAHLTNASSTRSPGETIRLQEENRKLRDEVKLRALALKQAETDLFRLKHSAFLQPDPPEDQQYDGELKAPTGRRPSAGREILEASATDRRHKT